MAALVDIHVACISAVRKKKRNVTAKSTPFFSGKESSAYEQSVFLENSPSICNCFLLVPGLFTGGPLGWPTKRSWALLTTLHRSHTGENCAPFCRAITMAGVHNPKNWRQMNLDSLDIYRPLWIYIYILLTIYINHISYQNLIVMWCRVVWIYDDGPDGKDVRYHVRCTFLAAAKMYDTMCDVH